MSRRKKRILFDVLGDVAGVARTPRAPKGDRRSTTESKRSSKTAGRGTRKKPVADQENSGAATATIIAPGGDVRLSYNLVGALAIVFCVFVGFAYYFGLVHGAAEDEAKGQFRTALRSDSSSREDWGDHYAVRACSESYTAYTFDELCRVFREYENLLSNEGYDTFDTYDYEGKSGDGSGRIVVWVGRGRSTEELEELAEGLASIVYRGTRPFELAYPTLFKETL